MPIRLSCLTERTLVVAAHPDDEVIGIGGHMPDIQECTVVTVTDGSPRNLSDAIRLGFATRQEYARARREELLEALELAGVPDGRTIALEVRDQEATYEIKRIAERLRDLIARLRPAAVVTHPYEGGHPDHDATACAVHRAVAESVDPALLVEFTSYHSNGGELSAGDFLPVSENEILVSTLRADRSRLKRRMMESFRTQSGILNAFGTSEEKFRRAPAYDFTKPPHEGRLFYEQFEWGMTGGNFRKLAAGVACR
jgi:LmbE family N-acetylglucosaminyl deacetylase